MKVFLGKTIQQVLYLAQARNHHFAKEGEGLELNAKICLSLKPGVCGRSSQPPRAKGVWRRFWAMFLIFQMFLEPFERTNY